MKSDHIRLDEMRVDKISDRRGAESDGSIANVAYEISD